MLLETLRALIVAALLVVGPGYLLIQAVLPPAASRVNRTERAYLSVIGGIVLLTLVGLVLGFLPHATSRGHLSTLAFGAPTVEVTMLAVSALLFYIGFHRGAYPRLKTRLPQLNQVPLE